MSLPGEILLYKNFQFEDGSAKDKYFIVLNTADSEIPCLVLKTTSQSRRYADSSKGCNPLKSVFFVPALWGNCFRVDTYVQLPQIFEIGTQDLVDGCLCRKISNFSKLPDDCFSQLKQCLKNFREDISSYHWKIIYNA
jgi:hypothetical protein